MHKKIDLFNISIVAHKQEVIKWETNEDFCLSIQLIWYFSWGKEKNPLEFQRNQVNL